ncbi:MAG: flagellar export chaperone FliS [Chthoniobacteraceae bacterium]
MLAKYAKAYRSVAVTTATPGQLVLMLFDGALRFLSASLHGFELEGIGERIEQVNNNSIKAQKILRELQCSLDLKEGGEFAQRMYALYDYMIEQLIRANLTKDPAPMRLVDGMLREIRDAWALMLEQNATVAA